MANRRIEKKRERWARWSPPIRITVAEAQERLPRLIQRLTRRPEVYQIDVPSGGSAIMMSTRMSRVIDQRHQLGITRLRQLCNRGEKSPSVRASLIDAFATAGLTGVAVAWGGGGCPVQVEGMVDGIPFYFKARGAHWSCDVGGGLASTLTWSSGRRDRWSVRQPWGEFPMAGYMEVGDVAACLIAALTSYREDRAEGLVGPRRPDESRPLQGVPVAPSREAWDAAHPPMPGEPLET